MAFAIPKIEYKNTSVEADVSSGNATLTGIADTSDIEAGMTATGTGIQANSKVLSKTSNSVTLDKTASASNNDIQIAFAHVIAFDYQPIEPKGEKFDPKERVSVAIAGTRQVSIDYIEGVREFKFSFLSQSIYDLMKAFMQNWACKGEEFRYYEDKTSGSYTNYELQKLNFDPRKIAPKGATDFVWEIPLTFRRVL